MRRLVGNDNLVDVSLGSGLKLPCQWLIGSSEVEFLLAPDLRFVDGELWENLFHEIFGETLCET